MADGADDKAGDQCAVRVGADDCFVHDFFGSQDDFFRGEGHFFLLADDAPQVGIAVFIRALNMHDGHIRVQGGDGDDFLAGIRVGDTLDQWVGAFQVGGARLVHW